MKDTMTEPNIKQLIEFPPAGSVYMQITPAIAAEMLEYNDRNRPLAQRKVEEYANQMINGKWVYTRVPVIFSDKGRLIDGQHRLSAIVESGAIIEADVAFGAPDEAFSFIDIGKKRTASDIFSINGVENSATIAAASAWVYKYSAGAMHGGGVKLTAAELYDFYLDHPRLQGSVKYGAKFKASKLTSPSLMTALHYICANKCRADADHFFTVAGEGLGATGKFDPAFVLRDRILQGVMNKDPLSRNHIAGLTINAWNQYRLGRSGRGLRYDATKAFPRAR